MGKDLKGREIGPGFCQRKDGKYVARYVNPYGQRISLYSVDLKELKKRYNAKIYELENHFNPENETITVDAAVELFESEKNNRDQRRKKREEREKKA